MGKSSEYNCNGVNINFFNGKNFIYYAYFLQHYKQFISADFHLCFKLILFVMVKTLFTKYNVKNTTFTISNIILIKKKSEECHSEV